MRFIAVLLSATLVAAGAARAEESEADRGRALALNVCGACHIVEKGQPKPPTLKPPAPAFTALLKRGALDEERLRAFLQQPHGSLGARAKMPNPRLLEYQIDRLIAFAATLRTAR